MFDPKYVEVLDELLKMEERIEALERRLPKETDVSQGKQAESNLEKVLKYHMEGPPPEQTLAEKFQEAYLKGDHHICTVLGAAQRAAEIAEAHYAKEIEAARKEGRKWVDMSMYENGKKAATAELRSKFDKLAYCYCSNLDEMRERLKVGLFGGDGK